MITNWNINNRVRITKKSWENIKNGNRSIHCYPSDSFVSITYVLMKNEIRGNVSKKFTPGYEVNVTFDNGIILQVKDHWIESVENDGVSG